MSEILEPYLAMLNFKTGTLKPFKKKVEVRLSDLKDFFSDQEAVNKMLSKSKNPIIYEYYENSQPEVEGHLNFGITIINPGKIGKEYYLTRGHYHAKEGTAEVYVGLNGKGVIILQNKDGRATHLFMKKGTIAYVPPFWAHRTVNIGKSKFCFLYIYFSDSGHDYEIIKQKGFAKLVIEEKGKPKIIDNPKFIKD
ncbi:MAG: glucose-6-phosphate isomerase family protein [Candidatus Methanomethylicaceae archaeon]